MGKLDNVSKFQFWAHKIIPLVYDDSLSYYEFLCKVLQKLNEVIDALNKQNEEIERFEQEMLDLFEQYKEQVEEEIKRFENLFFDDFDSTKSYQEGDYILHNNEILRALHDVEAGAFNSSDWLGVVFGNDVVYWKRWLVNYIDTGITTLKLQIAPVYVDDHTYAKDSFVWHEGKLYRANVEVWDDETWDATHWDEVVLTEAIASTLSTLSQRIGTEASTRLLADEALERNKTRAIAGVNSEQATVSVSKTVDPATLAYLDEEIYRMNYSADYDVRIIVKQTNFISSGEGRSDDNNAYFKVETYDENDVLLGSYEGKGELLGAERCGSCGIYHNVDGAYVVVKVTSDTVASITNMSVNCTVQVCHTLANETYPYLGAFSSDTFRDYLTKNGVNKFGDIVDRVRETNVADNVPAGTTLICAFDNFSVSKNTLAIVKLTTFENVSNPPIMTAAITRNGSTTVSNLTAINSEGEIVTAVKLQTGDTCELRIESVENTGSAAIPISLKGETILIDDSTDFTTFMGFGAFSAGAFASYVLNAIGTVDTGTIVRSTTVRHIVTCTQAQYDALGTKDANTLYLIVG